MSFDQKALTKKFKYSEKLISFKRPRSVSEIHLSVYRTKLFANKVNMLIFFDKTKFLANQATYLNKRVFLQYNIDKTGTGVSSRCVKIFKNNKNILKSPLFFRMRCISFAKKFLNK